MLRPPDWRSQMAAALVICMFHTIARMKSNGSELQVFSVAEMATPFTVMECLSNVG